MARKRKRKLFDLGADAATDAPTVVTMAEKAAKALSFGDLSDIAAAMGDVRRNNKRGQVVLPARGRIDAPLDEGEPVGKPRQRHPKPFGVKLWHTFAHRRYKYQQWYVTRRDRDEAFKAHEKQAKLFDWISVEKIER